MEVTNNTDNDELNISFISLIRFDVEPFKRNQFKAHEVPRGVNKKTLNDFVAHNPIRNEQVLSDLQKVYKTFLYTYT